MITSLNIYNSRPDKYGNVYWAFEANDSGGRCVRALAGGERNVTAALPGVPYHSFTLDARDYDRKVKGWPLATDPVRGFVDSQLAKLKG